MESLMLERKEQDARCLLREHTFARLKFSVEVAEALTNTGLECKDIHECRPVFEVLRHFGVRLQYCQMGGAPRQRETHVALGGVVDDGVDSTLNTDY